MRFVILIFAIIWSLSDLHSQSINTEFGKNRVQFHDDFNNWWQYETENFVTYWYGKGRYIAEPVMQMAELDHDEIQRVLEHRMNDKIEIIVYVDVTDLKQSNIGTEETFTNKTGETKIVGNKMFVYFDGNHQNLRKQIKEGIATVYLNNMLFGSNLQEIIQNAVLLNVPDWYKQGMVAYTASSWDLNIEDEMRDLWSKNEKFHNFNKMATINPRVAGHSFWFYIDQNYGKSSISNLLYLTKISRGTDNSFEYILNADLPTLMIDWQNFYTQYFASEKGKFEANRTSDEQKLSNKKGNPVTAFKLNPAGNKLLYVVNDKGKYKVFLKDLKTRKEVKILQYGYRNYFQETDFNYPILAWHPSKPELSIIYEHKDVIKLMKYNIDVNEKMEQIIPNDFQRIYSFSYIDDLDYVFSASQDGFSDIFTYKSKNRNYFRITNDYFDDLDVEYIDFKGEKGVLFSSNRLTDSLKTLKLDTILPTGNFDLFFLPMGESKFVRLTNTNTINERYPYLISESKLVYLSDASGINNANVLDLNTLLSHPITNVDRNILKHHAIKGSNKYLNTIVKDGKYHLYEYDADINKVTVPFITQARSTIEQNDEVPLVISNQSIDPPAVVIEPGFLFQSKYPDPPKLEPISTQTFQKEANRLSLNYRKPSDTHKRIEPYVHTRAIAANKKFGLNNITTKLDNDLLFEGLESYTGNRQQLLTAPMGILLKANIKDLFEDYTLEGGVRIPTSFNGSEFFLVFDNKKSRIDRKFALYRKTSKYDTTEESDFLQRSKKTSLLGLYQLKYPFDIYRSIRATTSMRLDNFIQLSTEKTSFEAPAYFEKRISLKLEYIYDNTHDVSLNIKNGSRYKIYSEVINHFDLQILDGFSINPSVGFTGIFGFDARHYLPILGKSILALRASGATSFGSEKMLYYLGGVENWLTPKFDQTIPERTDVDFAYKANVYQMRGFSQNIRNGATYTVANAELRIPFMLYLLGNRGSAFFRNMQIVGFYDAGLAWHGKTPFSAENPLNKIQVTSPPLIVLDVEYYRDPLVMGFGTGLRTQLLGYFIKLDRAWGIETKQIQSPRWYFSFGTDF